MTRRRCQRKTRTGRALTTPGPCLAQPPWTKIGLANVTISALPEPNGTNHARVTDPIFAVLTTRELDVLLAVLGAGWRITGAVHPTLCPLWQDTADLLGDLHAAWEIVFARENPNLAALAVGS